MALGTAPTMTQRYVKVNRKRPRSLEPRVKRAAVHPEQKGAHNAHRCFFQDLVWVRRVVEIRVGERRGRSGQPLPLNWEAG